MKNERINQFYKFWNSRTIFWSLSMLVLVLSSGFLFGFKKEFILFSLPVFIAGLIMIAKKFIIDRKAVYGYLHKNYPNFEYSLALILQPEADLSLLGKLQKQKVETQLMETPLQLPSPLPLIYRLMGWSMLFLMFGALHLFTGHISNADFPADKDMVSILNKDTVTNDTAYLENLKARVIPPKYTQITSYSANDLELEVPEGSEVVWNYMAKGPVEGVSFLFGEDESSTSEVSGVYKKTFYDSEFYIVTVKDSFGNRNASEFLPVKVKEDERPDIEIKGIAEYQRLSWKEEYSFDFDVVLIDDYGLEDAFIIATVANGSGESVQFRERKIPLSKFLTGQKKYLGNVKLSSREFGMEPGSELYFYVIAKDNCPFRIQVAKSKTHFLILEDTIQYAYFDDGGMQVDMMPDFFRSQRQIIIDTEKLVEDKSSISKEAFNQRSNELGFDQKMLRLKYGQFLGEEAESGIALENKIEEEDHSGHNHDHEEGEDEKEKILNQYGHNHDHGAEEHMPIDDGNAAKDPNRPEWMEELMHNHDDAEVNTFYEVSLKTKLKAALSVMWDAELYLRLYEPQNSLPHQYKALKLLDEIKNHARVYVHRIGFDPPVIKEQEKRLTGKLEDIVSPTRSQQFEVSNAFEYVKAVIKELEFSSTNEFVILTDEQKDGLEKAGRELANYAIQDLSLLPILNKIRTIIESDPGIALSSIVSLRQELLTALPNEAPQTQKSKSNRHPLNRKVVAVLEGFE